MSHDPLTRYLDAATWPDAVQIADAELRSPEWAARLTADAAAAEGQGEDASAASLRRYAAVLDALRDDGAEAAVSLATSRIDPEEPKDRQAWAEVIARAAAAEPAELAVLVDGQPWLLSDATDTVLRRAVEEFVAQTELGSALTAEYRRLLLRAFRRSGPQLTVAAVLPPGDAGQRAARLRDAVLRASRAGDAEEVLLRKLAWHNDVSAPESTAALNDVGSSLALRYRHTGDRADLAFALLIRRAVCGELGPSSGHQLVSAAMVNLADTMTLWEQETGDLTYRDEAIALYRLYLASSGPDDPLRPSSAVGLAGLLVSESQRPGRGIELLDEAEAVLDEMLPALAGVDEEKRIVGLIHLATADLVRFERAGPPVPARRSVATAADAIRQLPPDGPHRRRLAQALSGAVLRTVTTRGDTELNDAAAELAALASDSIGHGSPGVGSLLDRAQALLNRYESRGAAADLREALDAARQVLRGAEPGSVIELQARTVLGSALTLKFEGGGDLADLDEAVTQLRLAVETQEQPGCEPVVPGAFQNLSGALFERYQHTRQATDLDDGIAVATRLLAVTAAGDPRRLGRASSLAAMLRKRHLHRGDRRDLDQCLTLVQDALTAARPDSPGRTIATSTLALGLRDRFLADGDPGDATQAAALLRSAVEETPATAPHLEQLLSNYLLVLTTVVSRDRERRRLDTGDLQRWLAVTGRNVLRECRATGDVRAVLAAVTGPPAQPAGDEPEDRDLPEIPEDDPDAITDDARPRSLLAPGGHVVLPQLMSVFALRAMDATGRYATSRDPADLDEAVAQWGSAVRHPEFGTMPRRSQRELAIGAARAAFMHVEHDDSIEAMDRLIGAFNLLLSLSDDDHDRAVVSYDLARTLMHRFDRSGDQADIDRAFDIAGAALAPLPAGDTTWRRGVRFLAGCLQLYLREGRLAAARRGRLDQLSSLAEALGPAGDTPFWQRVRLMLLEAYAAPSPDADRQIDALTRSSRIVTQAIAAARRMGDDEAPASFAAMEQSLQDMTTLAEQDKEPVTVTVGGLLAETDDPDEARQHLDLMRSLYRRMDPQADYRAWSCVAAAFVVLLNRGGPVGMAERQDEALDVAAAIEQAAEARADLETRSIALRTQGELCLDRIHGIRAENLDRAVACAERDLGCQVPGSGEWAVCKALLGSSLSRRVTSGRPARGDVGRAVRECREAVAALDQATGPEIRAKVHYLLGGVLYECANSRLADGIEEAIDAYRVALRYQPAGGVAWANAHHQLGVMYTNRLRANQEENLAVALEHFAAELTVFTRERHPVDWAFAMVSRGNALSQIRGGDPRRSGAEAAEAFEAALAVFTRETFPHQWARTRASQGLLALDSDRVGGREVDARAALVHLNAALEVYDRSHDRVEWARVHEFLSVGELALAIAGGAEHFRRAAEHASLALSIPDVPPVTRARRLVNLGSARLGLAEGEPGEPTAHLAEAARALEEALAIFDHNGLVPQTRDAAAALIDAYSGLGYWTRAAEAYDTGIAAAERGYAETLLVSSRAAELRGGALLVRSGVQALARAGRTADALVALERGRARWLGESIDRDRADLDRLATDHPGLVTEFQHAAGLVRTAETAERVATDTAGYAALREQAAQARSALEQGTARIRRLPGYEQFLDLPTLSDIRRVVNAGTALVYLLPGDSDGLMLIAHHDVGGQLSMSGRRLPQLTTGAVNRLLVEEGYLAAQMDGGADLQAVLEPVLARLGAMLADVAETLRQLGAKAVTLIACGRLAVLPVHAASYPTAKGPRSLLEEFTVSFAPSAWVLSHTADTHVAPVLAGVGDPTGDLRYARTELAGIADVFPSADPDRLLYGSAATRAALLAKVPGATYVHLSCHGYYDLATPMNSHLLLAGGERLTLGELLAGNVLHGVRLAVASACQTALTDIVGLPDEAIGLPAGFLRAGASAVVGTLWPVADLPTALLMHRFYECHLTGDPQADDGRPMPPAQALRAAQLWLARLTTTELARYFPGETTAGSAGETAKKPYAHPYYWAPFVLAGK